MAVENRIRCYGSWWLLRCLGWLGLLLCWGFGQPGRGRVEIHFPMVLILLGGRCRSHGLKVQGFD